MQCVLFLYKKLKDNNTFFSFSKTFVSISVSICSFLMAIIIFVLAGFKYEIKKNIYDFAGNYQFYKYNKEPFSFSDFSKNFSQIKGLKKLSPYIKKSVLFQCHDFVEGTVLLGSDIKSSKLDRYICKGEVCKNTNEIIIGKTLFEKINVTINEDIISCILEDNSFCKYKIVGVFETGIDELDEKISLCNISELQRINNWGCDMCEGVNLYHVGEYEILKKKSKEYSGRLIKIESQYEHVMDWIKILEKNGNLYMFIIFCVILTNIICLLILQIFERKQMINLLLYMGARTSQIDNIFILKNIRNVITNIICGVSLAFVFGYLQWRYKLIQLNPSDYYLSFVPICFDIKKIFYCFSIEILGVMGVLKIVSFFIKKK